MMAIVAATSLAACTDPAPGPQVTATQTAAPADDAADAPNSFPGAGTLIRTPIQPETGVIGVGHLPP